MGELSALAGFPLNGVSSRPRRKAEAGAAQARKTDRQTKTVRTMLRSSARWARPLERDGGSPPPSAILHRSHAQDEDPFRGEEALQADGQEEGPGPSLVHEPHARAQEREA